MSRGRERPVERVLERAGDRAVVLGRHDQDGVRLGDRRAERRDGERGRVLLVLVERRQVAEPIPDGVVHAVREVRPQQAAGAGGCTTLRGGCLQCRGASWPTPPDQLELGDELDVVADGEAAGRKRRVPVEAERRPVDDRLELEAEARRCRRGASTGPVTVPVILTGLVVPLIVSSPSMSSLSPSTRIAVELNESCGLRSASKKSGESRWPLRFGSETPIDADVDGAAQARLVERDGERVEAAAEVRDDHVLDREADRRVDGIDLPRAGRKRGACF